MPNNTTSGNQQGPEIRRFREVVANMVGELRSQEVRKSFAAISIEELVDDQISQLEAGASLDPMRPSRMDRLQKIKDDFDASFDAIKATPPEAFIPADGSTNVNTPQSGTGGP